MHMRRSELKQQLQEISGRRRQLLEQALLTPPARRASIDQRIAELDERAARLDRQILQADDAIADAIARGVANQAPSPAVEAISVQPSTPPPPVFVGRQADGERVAAMLLGEALLFVVVGMFMYRRLKRRLTTPDAPAAADRARLDQLQQAVDVIAVEVERVAEGQRFVARALNDKLQLGVGEAQPVDQGAREADRVKRNP